LDRKLVQIRNSLNEFDCRAGDHVVRHFWHVLLIRAVFLSRSFRPPVAEPAIGVQRLTSRTLPERLPVFSEALATDGRAPVALYPAQATLASQEK
jgi:hypothetical protein